MKFTKIITLALALIFTGSVFVPAAAASTLNYKAVPTQAANPLKNIAVTDTAGNLTGGALSINSFAVRKGKVMANGTLTGTVNGEQITKAVSLPVTTGQHSCDILNLQLGPLDLDLLGLRVQLSPVDLNITAEQGSGNLLGNLLCEVAQLLDGNGRALGKLAGLLNDILRALG